MELLRSKILTHILQDFASNLKLCANFKTNYNCTQLSSQKYWVYLNLCYKINKLFWINVYVSFMNSSFTYKRINK